ncbi:MAG: hypothetical protein HYX94_01185 [Chloroflexi bacterium]|nr:hypothetical protein [Chloroflexota bacterium]
MGRTDVRQANFLLPVDLIEELRRSVPRREQSKLAVDALRNELRRLCLRRSLDESFGAWSEELHPELAKGVEHFIRAGRQSSRRARRPEP